MSSHQSVSRLVRESLAVVTNIFNKSWTRDRGGDLRSLGVWLKKDKSKMLDSTCVILSTILKYTVSYIKFLWGLNSVFVCIPESRMSVQYPSQFSVETMVTLVASLCLQEGTCIKTCQLFSWRREVYCYKAATLPLSYEFCHILFIESESRVFVAPPIPLENLFPAYTHKSLIHHNLPQASS